MRAYLSLMREIGGCYSFREFFERVGTSRMMATWLLYLEMVAEENKPAEETQEKGGE